MKKISILLLTALCTAAVQGQESKENVALYATDSSGQNAAKSGSTPSGSRQHPAEPEMVFVPGGTFWMISLQEEHPDSSESDENLLHSVTMSSFHIGKYEVTQAQWKLLMDNNPSDFKGDNLPVENVSWNDVQEFIARLNAATGKQYRLPTETEWEYAAREGTKRSSYEYSGSDGISDVAWFDGNSSEKTHPVGQKSPNSLGIYDMSGNVWEWCQDCYDASCLHRVDRGGSWYDCAQACRVADRCSSSPSNCYSNLGFRLVLP
ncbi:MAG: formylglycine-generating enzyme family protein [Prevotellaceae bacterium]|jgi:formylglycine-generating enzyme required for sulfatase activity|nr:formylglycine-generating enzyme family protein [Prevotellaceae bacterium]